MTKNINLACVVLIILFLKTALAQENAIIIAEENIKSSFSNFTLPMPVALKINLTNGTRSIISQSKSQDFENPTPDRSWGLVSALAVESNGNLVVASNLSNGLPESYGHISLHRIDSKTGNRKLISDFNNSDQGVLRQLSKVYDIAIDKTGNAIISTSSSENSTKNLLLSVDLSNGKREIISDGDRLSQGPGKGFRSIAITSENAIITDYIGNIYQIDKNIGARSILSDLNNVLQGPIIFGLPQTQYLGFWDIQVSLPRYPLTVDSSGNIFGVLPGVGLDNYGILVSINPATGYRKIISDFGDNSQGQIIYNPINIKATSAGQILVLDDGGNITGGALFSIDRSNGYRSLISDFSSSKQGPGKKPVALAVGNIGDTENLGYLNDIGFDFVASNSSVTIGENLSLSTSLVNNTDATLTNTKLSINLPKNLKSITVTSSQGSCKGKTKVQCKFNTISAGASVSVTIETVVNKAYKKPKTVSGKARIAFTMPKHITYGKLKAFSKTSKAEFILTPN
ncbi:DUF11 domain-containing protein [Methylomonas rhizoryzae]|uniref:DUF11 domain-containing protein n=1 Tax=Methylomonas rhizoryzae TaxID=2608981 RepID=UPI0012325CB6|nr:DUF11 domain-containing protein [Methylomonas rhizoryzae]